MGSLLAETKVYGGRLKNETNYMSSSSGGAFTAISDTILNNGGAVVCAIYDYDCRRTKFQLITTPKERDIARGSKYMQSFPNDVFTKSYEWLGLNPEKELLFVGLGCQAEGFRKYAEMKGIRERVYIIDLICHGAISPMIWSQYAEILEERHGGKIEYLTFREKKSGWPSAAVMIKGEIISLKEYMTVYSSRCAYRPTCYVCPFATTERKTDITIGDFWHLEKKMPEFYDRNGTSLFLLHTDRGEKLFGNIKVDLDYRESNTTDCWQLNLEKPTPLSKKRNKFWSDYKKYGINYIMKKYGTIPVYVKIKKKIKKKIRGGIF